MLTQAHMLTHTHTYTGTAGARDTAVATTGGHAAAAGSEQRATITDCSLHGSRTGGRCTCMHVFVCMRTANTHARE